jgi:hypothetical protein
MCGRDVYVVLIAHHRRQRCPHLPASTIMKSQIYRNLSEPTNEPASTTEGLGFYRGWRITKEKLRDGPWQIFMAEERISRLDCQKLQITWSGTIELTVYLLDR